MILFGLNNRIDLAALTSSATYTSELPLTNLKTNILSQKARTTDTGAFTLTIDISAQPARAIGAVAIAGHNLSAAATVQIQTYQNTTEKDDSGLLSPWPYLHQDDPHWLTHTYAAAIIDSQRIAEATPTCAYFLPENQAANKVIITITDTGNADGYIQLGRLFIGEQLEPDMAEEWDGDQWGTLDYSEITKTKRRTQFARTYKPLRTLQIDLGHLTNSEAQAALINAQQATGYTGEWLVAKGRPTLADISGTNAVDSLWFQRAFLANPTTLDALKHPYFGANSLALSFEEVAP